MSHFNRLTPAEAERLAMLCEEAGEVVQAASDALVEGAAQPGPEAALAPELEKEILDLVAICRMMEADLDPVVPPAGETKIREDAAFAAQLCRQCGQLIQAATKTLRHGYASYHPFRPDLGDNRRQLSLLVREILALVQARGVSGDLDAILARKQRYMHHQEKAA